MRKGKLKKKLKDRKEKVKEEKGRRGRKNE